VFAAVIGIVFVAGIVLWPDILKASPEMVLKAWIIVSGAFLIIWGAIRIVSTTKKTDLRIGQPTINMTVGIMAVTAAIFAIVATAPHH
jgi:hypothetical protein